MIIPKIEVRKVDEGVMITLVQMLLDEALKNQYHARMHRNLVIPELTGV